MAGNNVNLNQGLDFINKYLKDLGIDKKVSSSEVASIFKDLEKNEDGTVETSAFALAVANAYGDEQMSSIEDEYLEAWEAISGIDGDDETISSDDIAGLESQTGTDGANSSTGAGASGGAGSSGGAGAGAGNSPIGQNAGMLGQEGPVSSVPSASISGNESVSELEAAKGEAQAQLQEMQAQKDNNEEVIAAEQAVTDAKTAYDDAMKSFEENAADLYEKVEEAKQNKENCDNTVNEKKSAVDTAKSEVSQCQGALAGLVEPPQTITETNPETGETVEKENPAYAQYLEKKAELEAALEEAEANLTTAEGELATAEEAATAANEALTNIMQSEEMQENQYAMAVSEALNTYIEAQSNLTVVETEQNAQVDADIAQINQNIAAYDTAIEQAKAREEAEQAAQNNGNKTGSVAEDGTETAESLLQPEEEECIADPIGFAFEDEEGNAVDLKLVKDDGNFDSVSDFLGSASEGISDLTKLADEDGIINGQALQDAGVKFATVIDGKAVSLSFDEVKEMYGVSDIKIDANKIDPDYEGDQEFGVTVDFAEQKDENGNVVKEASSQDVQGYSNYQTAEEIKAMEGYSDLIGDYGDTYRDENGVLKDLPEQFKGSEYAKYIHVDENGNYYINIDVDNTWNLNGENEQDSNGESLDEIITELYSLDSESADYETTLASLKAAIKVANSAEQKSSASSSSEGDIYIYGAKGTISSNYTEDGSKLLLVDKDAALENITSESEWYQKSEGATNYRDWAGDAAAQTELIEKLTANQGFTRDSEGRKVLDETSDEFSNLLQSLTSDVLDEDNNVLSTPEEVWANADFSQYAPETVLKLAQAFENNVDADGRTFLEAAQYYCGNGQAEDELNAVTNAILSKAGNEQSALDMVTKEIESALTDGDTDSIKTLLNAAQNNQLDMQVVLKQYENNNEGISLSENLQEFGLNANELTKYKNIISECEKALDNDTKDLVNRLGSSVDEDRKELSGVAEKAWEELDVNKMTPADLLKVQQGYDSVYGKGSFMERAEQLYPESTFDRIMNAVDTIEVDSSVTGYTKVDVNGAEQSINDFIKSLDYAGGINNLESLSDEDIANVASVYDSVNGDGAFKTFMESGQKDYEPSKIYDIRQKLNEAGSEAQISAEQGEKAENLNSYIDRIVNSADYLRPGERPDDEYFISVIEDAISDINDISDPMALLETLKEEQPDIINSMDKDNKLDSIYVDIFEAMSNGSASVDDIIALDTRYKELTGKDSVDLILESDYQQTYVDSVLNLYNGATAEEIANLNATFTPIELIKEAFEGDTDAQAEKITNLFSNMFGDVESFMSDYEDNFESAWEQTYEDYFNSEFGTPGEESFITVLETIGDGIFTDTEDAKAALLYAAGGSVNNIVDYFVSDGKMLSDDSAAVYMPMVMDLFKGVVPNETDGTIINSEYMEPSEDVSEWAKEFSNEDTLSHIKLLEANARQIEYLKDDSMLSSDYQDAISETPLLIRNAMMDENVPVEDKIMILNKMQETNPDAMNSFLGGINDGYSFDESGNPIYSYDLIADIVDNASASEAIELIDLFNVVYDSETGLSDYMYNHIQQNSQMAIDFSNSLIDLYFNANAEQKVKLNDSLDISYIIQQTLSGDNEDQVVGNMFNKFISDLPDNINAYASTQSEKEKLEILSQSSYISTNKKDTIYNILKGYQDNRLNANEAAYLLSYAGADAESITALSGGFRNMSSKNEENLLPVFMQIFSSVNY